MEFALVGPILIAILLAAVVYGGWFLMAQSVQSLASEAARAAIGGWTPRNGRGWPAPRPPPPRVISAFWTRPVWLSG